MTLPDKDGFVPVALGVPAGTSRETATVQPKVRSHLIACPVTAPSGSWSHPSEPANWVMVWVPRHATITPRVINVWMLPSRYVGSGRGEYGYPVGFSTLAGAYLAEGWNLSGVGIIDGEPEHWWNYGPYAWVNSGDPGYLVGSGWPHTMWTNTGVSQYVVVQSSATQSYAGADSVWSLELTIEGGVFGIPPLRQRARADGLTSDTRQQRDSNSSPQRTAQWWVGKYGSW